MEAIIGIVVIFVIFALLGQINTDDEETAKGLGTFLLLLYFLLMGFIVYVKDNLAQKEEIKQFNKLQNEHQLEFDNFIKQVDSTLIYKIYKVQETLSDVDKKISKLNNLKSNTSKGNIEFIDNKINKWTNLRAELNSKLQQIQTQLEDAFVMIKISEIYNQNAFNQLSKKVLLSVNQILSQAEFIQKTMKEETLHD